MANKTLSVFIDESGDFGKFDPKSPYYYVSMVLHDQSIDISSEIESLEQRVSNYGFPHHAIHVGPIIRREQIYRNELMENRKSLFNALFHFTRKTKVDDPPKITGRHTEGIAKTIGGKVIFVNEFKSLDDVYALMLKQANYEAAKHKTTIRAYCEKNIELLNDQIRKFNAEKNFYTDMLNEV